MSSNTEIDTDVVPRNEEGDAAAIHIENLSKIFDTSEGKEEVFSDINITVEPSQFVCLLGKSGSGKSTMLNIISDVLEPTEGQIRIEYPNENDKPELGFVFQDPRLLPWDTCIDNIEYVHEDNPEYSDKLAKEHLDLVGLSEHYDKYPTQLSGGQQQRVGIARALSIDPGVLLMDEPFSNLDEITAEELRDELINIWQKLNKTVFFVTHDMTEAIQLADRLLMLGQGQIYADMDVPLERPRNVDSDKFLEFRQKAIDKFHSIDQ